jgi:hypothetical protein
VGDTGAKRAAGSPLGIDMNPLVIASGVGEQVDPLLADAQPVGAAQVHALGVEQRLSAGKYMSHLHVLRLAAS